ncbi:SMC family ATPase [Candidatus Woesearchaeota archaeon]|nr:SMC family ATPase [Candidatus Woesearchaeota archaeon]
MILRSIKLRNIRSYREAEVSFPEGSILLAGDIGSGKSTILLAIEFALFGIRRGELSGSALLRYGKNQGEVVLEFEVDDKEVIIQRTLKRTRQSILQDSGYVIINGIKSELTPTELKSKVIELMGYPEELLTKSKSLVYRYTVYVPQEEMKQILYEDKEIRLNTLRKVFGIDKYKQVRENTLIFNRELKRKVSELSTRIEDLEEKQKQRSEREHSIKEINIKLGEIESELKGLNNDITKKKQELEKLDEQTAYSNQLIKELEVAKTKVNANKNQVKKLIEDIRELKEKNSQLQEQITAFGELKETKDEESLESEIEEKQELLNNLVKDKAATEEKMKAVQNHIALLRDEIKKLSQESKEIIIKESTLQNIEDRIANKPKFEKKLSELDHKIKLQIAGINKLEEKLDHAERIKQDIIKSDICPLCKQNITTGHRDSVVKQENHLIKQVQDQLNKQLEQKSTTEKNIDKVKSSISLVSKMESQAVQLRTELKNLEKSSNSIVQKQKQLSELSDKKQDLEKKIEHLNGLDIEGIKNKIGACQKKLKLAREHNTKYREKKNIEQILKQNISYISRLEQQEKELMGNIQQQRERMAQLTNQLEGLENLPQLFLKTKEELDRLMEKEKLLEIRRGEFNQEKKSLHDIIADLNNDIEAKLNIKDRLQYCKEINNWIEESFLNLMSTIERHVMLTIYNEFNSLLKEWFALMIDNIEIKLDEEFTPIIIQNNYETEVENLSGGEKTAVALAYRLALNKVINDLIAQIKTKDLIILDEPTDGFSSEQLDKVRDVFDQLEMKQIIIVSHEPKVETFVENVIRVVKTEHQSKILI